MFFYVRILTEYTTHEVHCCYNLPPGYLLCVELLQFTELTENVSYTHMIL